MSARRWFAALRKDSKGDVNMMRSHKTVSGIMEDVTREYDLKHASWTLTLVRDGRETGGPPMIGIPAAVPSCVHTDLLAAGLIDDPYGHDMESKLAWIGESDWLYECQFDAVAEMLADERIELVCEGLDTVATLTLNGTEIARTENMHVRYRFDVKDRVRAGANTLRIRFDSPCAYARRMHKQTGEVVYAFDHLPPNNAIRKATCHFGWDWGPSLPSAGVWRPIYLESGPTVRIAAVRPSVVEATAERATVDIAVDRTAGGDKLTVEACLLAPDGHCVATAKGAAASCSRLRLHVAQPRLWWPVGYGAQPRYTLAVRITDLAGETLDTWAKQIGLRLAEIVSEPDAGGRSFAIRINGQPVFARGYDWIPDDCFPSRVSDARTCERLQQALDSHANIIRVWGGGLFESDAFYDFCDAHGLMVWQDFLFACSGYPEAEPFPSLIEAEARDNLNRLAHHPSLTVLNGGNETIWGQYFRYYLKPGSPGWGLKYYLDLLPKLCAELTPAVPYLPNSPWSGELGIHPYEAEFGCVHQWMRWRGGLLYGERYREFRPRFVSEFGHQGPPAISTLLASLPADQRQIDSPAMRYREKALGGNPLDERIGQPLRELFEEPADLDRWHYLAQLSQARHMRVGVDYYRSLQPYCMGAIVWQLNDCWPVHSWAAVDGNGIPKLLWYALRDAFKPRHLSVRRETGETPFVFAANDTGAPWTGTLAISRRNMAGEVLAEAEIPFDLAPREARRLTCAPMRVSWPNNRTGEFLVVATGDIRVLHFFEPDKALEYPAAAFDAAVERSAEGYRVTVTAKSLVRDLVIFADRLDPKARVDMQMLVLLPGERGVFNVVTNAELDPAALAAFPVLQAVNQPDVPTPAPAGETDACVKGSCL